MRASVLMIGANGWHLAWPGAEPVAVEPSAEAVRAALDASGRRPAVVVALPAAWCMAANVDATGLPRRGRRRALLYRFEDKLPLAAEEVAAAFVEADGRALGVAVEARRLAELVDPLEAAGVEVRHACPAALLATAAFPAEDADAVLWQNDDAAEAVLLRGGSPAGLLALPHDGLAPQLRLATLDLDREPRVAVHAVPEADLGDLDVLDADDFPLIEAVAEAVAESKGTPPGDVLSGLEGRADPARRRLRAPITAALLAACLALAAAAGGALWRASQYEDAARAAEARLAAAFARAFPGQRVPAAANAARRLQIAATTSTDTADTGGPPSALAALGRAVAALEDVPDTRRFRVLQLNLSRGEATVAGEARSLADADAVATALRDAAGFAVEPPNAEQVEPGRVSFRLIGTYGGGGQ